MESEKKSVDDIINMLDQFVTNGGGHMNVVVEESEIECEKITQTLSVDCSKTPTACSIPTLHQGIDDEL